MESVAYSLHRVSPGPLRKERKAAPSDSTGLGGHSRTGESDRRQVGFLEQKGRGDGGATDSPGLYGLRGSRVGPRLSVASKIT
jgi:hypothetical protein